MTQPSQGRSKLRRWLLAGVLALGLLLGCLASQRYFTSSRPVVPPPVAAVREAPRLLEAGKHLSVWWSILPANLAVSATGTESNIHPADYVGPDACRQCHARNYESWATHPHRWMNALADNTTVKGDFSPQASISYRGGRASFEQHDGRYFMRLQRDSVQRLYQITQTIGSRFFQYYVGKQLEGPEPAGHRFYERDHVLYLGYWLEQKEWVPIVHVGPELPELERPDPFAPPEQGRHYADYASGCNGCHTTFPLADLFGRRPRQLGLHVPHDLHWSLGDYLAQAHPETRAQLVEQAKHGDRTENPMIGWEAPRYAATLGVSCEACHLGGRAHVESRGKVPPKFFPESPYLRVAGSAEALEYGRNHDNLNWACGRCHTGNRPQFAAGMSTWNSVEYADAMRGSCYSQLRCIDCHNPHQALGPAWTRPPDQDDALCLKCHSQLAAAPARLAHTHHPAGSAGARCMNCHMPRINEGIDDIVRTHMIYSPTRADMLEANHPNACNLCHAEQPIDWTVRYLKQWYGKNYDEGKITANYPNRKQPVGAGWLASTNPSVRLVAVETLARSGDPRVVPQLLDALDDPYLVNRQFAYKGLQKWWHLHPADFGYRIYLTKAERQAPLAALRAQLARGSK